MNNSERKTRYSYSVIEDDIETRIRNKTLENDDRILSENELSKKYNISRMSARQAITNLVNRKLLYRIAGKGTFVAAVEEGEEKSIIALVLNNMANPFFAQLAKAVQKKALQSGYDVIYYANDNLLDESKSVDIIIKRRIAGVILVPSQENGEENIIKKIDSEKIPFVYLNKKVKHPESDSVTVSNKDGARQVMEHLYALGHRRIGFIAASPYSSAIAERLEEFNSFMKKHRLSESAKVQISGLLNEKGGYEAGKIILSSSNRVTAIFCANDIVAIGALRAVTELGLKVPKDLSIVGYDDISSAEYLSPSLTTISQPLETMAGAAVDILIKKINERGNNSWRRKDLIFPPKLIIRESSDKTF